MPRVNKTNSPILIRAQLDFWLVLRCPQKLLDFSLSCIYGIYKTDLVNLQRQQNSYNSKFKTEVQKLKCFEMLQNINFLCLSGKGVDTENTHSTYSP